MKLNKKQLRKRNLMMTAGAFAIFFTGFPHIWSIYQPYVMEQTGWTQTQASMCFYLSLVTFVIGNIVGGMIQDRHNPKVAIVSGGGIFAAGVILSAFVISPSPIPIYLTYGVMQGFGQGMIYTTTLSIAQKWFPHKTGFASGVIVTANGLCGFFLTPLSKMILTKAGVETAFLVIGGLITVSWICSIFFVVKPDADTENNMREYLVKDKPESAVVERHQYTSGEMIRTRRFYFLAATMFTGLMSYFMVSPVSQLVQWERGISVTVAASAVMFGSVVNASTRLILPWLADKIGRVQCVRAITVVTVISMIILTFSRSYMTTVSIILVYGCYGGIMGSFPALTTSIFGMKYSGQNYGIVMSGIVLASLGAPFISGAVTNAGYNMDMVFKIGIAFSITALIFASLLGKELKRKTN